MDLVPAAVSAPLSPPPAAVGSAPPRDTPRRPVPAPETLHPTLWLGHQLARHADVAVPSGFKMLDAQLPGGGWPRRALTELLLPHAGVGEIRLLCASLVATQKAGRLVMLFDPPSALSAHALAQLGFDVEQLLIVNTRTRVIPGTDSLWALEQALKSGHVGAVLDGGIRDLTEIRRDYGFPVYARDVSPGTTLGRYRTVASQVPVRVGGIMVHPGDIVVGDVDGVVVVPHAQAAEVLAMAQEIDSRELEQAKLIMAEKSLRKGLAKYGRI